MVDLPAGHLTWCSAATGNALLTNSYMRLYLSCYQLNFVLCHACSYFSFIPSILLSLLTEKKMSIVNTVDDRRFDHL